MTKAVAVIGCGNIFHAYARGLSRADGVELAACADLDTDRARRAAAEYGMRALTVPEVLADPELPVVVNLTPPAFHAEVTRAALEAGKHVYSEKPLCATLAEAVEVADLAARQGLLLGSAPDTFLGSAGQTARAVVDSGQIGDVIGAGVFVTHSQAEMWHPNPGFLFQPGGGPALDMGPYYLASLVNLLGPVRRVYSESRIGSPVRPVFAEGRTVEEITVRTPTHCAAVVTFASGVIASVLMSFDVWGHELPHAELYGHLGTLSIPDPDKYDLPVRMRLHTDPDWRVVDPVVPSLTEGLGPDQLPLRGPGVADLVAALNGAPQRCSAALAVHVLEVLETIARGDGVPSEMTTTCDRPPAVAVSPEMSAR